MGYNIYSKYKNAQEKWQIAIEKRDNFYSNLTPETYQQYQQAFCALGGSLVELGASIPGTSISGPPPTGSLEIVIDAIRDFIIGLLS